MHNVYLPNAYKHALISNVLGGQKFRFIRIPIWQKLHCLLVPWMVYFNHKTLIISFITFLLMVHHSQVKSVHSNPFMKEVCPDGYTLKLLNSVESKRPAIVEAHNQLMWKLKDAGFRYAKAKNKTMIYQIGIYCFGVISRRK